jgi:hypothetical protein
MRKIPMKRFAFVFAFLACLACLAASPASAITTSKVTVNNSAWTSLGTGPLIVTFRGDGVYAVSDTTPVGSSPPLAEGLKVPAGTTVVVSTNSTVWAMSTSPLGVDVYTAPYTPPAAGTLSWPGTAAPTNFGTAPGAGTVPAVNASIFQNATSNPLLVNCTIGCAGGTFNNNADAVANSATNGQVASWNYGFNGTTWDRLRIDANKYLLVSAEATTTGGATPKIFSALTTTVLVQAGAHQVYKAQCDNIAGAAAAWVQLIDTASAGALGTGVVDQIPLPIGGTGGFALATGETFANGIVIGAATASNGATAVSTAVNCSVAYK